MNAIPLGAALNGQTESERRGFPLSLTLSFSKYSQIELSVEGRIPQEATPVMNERFLILLGKLLGNDFLSRYVRAFLLVSWRIGGVEARHSEQKGAISSILGKKITKLSTRFANLIPDHFPSNKALVHIREISGKKYRRVIWEPDYLAKIGVILRGDTGPIGFDREGLWEFIIKYIPQLADGNGRQPGTLKRRMASAIHALPANAGEGDATAVDVSVANEEIVKVIDLVRKRPKGEELENGLRCVNMPVARYLALCRLADENGLEAVYRRLDEGMSG